MKPINILIAGTYRETSEKLWPIVETSINRVVEMFELDYSQITLLRGAFMKHNSKNQMRGVDELVIEYAYKYNCEYTTYLQPYTGRKSKYDFSEKNWQAVTERNKLMTDSADLAIIFTDGKTGSVKDFIQRLAVSNVITLIIPINQGDVNVELIKENENDHT